MKDKFKTWDIYFGGGGFGYCFSGAIEWQCWSVDRADKFFGFGPFCISWNDLTTTHPHRWHFYANFGTIDLKGRQWKWWQKLLRYYG
jgi:hypothetical protein